MRAADKRDLHKTNIILFALGQFPKWKINLIFIKKIENFLHETLYILSTNVYNIYRKRLHR